MVGEGTLANERGEMRPFLGLKRGGALSGDKAPKGGALGQSATEVEGGMGSCERRPVATTLCRKKQAKDLNTNFTKEHMQMANKRVNNA